MPAENNVVIRLNVKSDTGAIARTQALLRTLGSDADRSGKLFGKTAKNIDFTKRSLTAFEKSAVVASKLLEANTYFCKSKFKGMKYLLESIFDWC